jgi:general L-amino acid transport system permease protein
MSPPSSSPRKKKWSWRSQAFRGLLFQLVTVAVIVLAVLYLARNTTTNMEARGIQSGFDFLSSPAGFDIGESLFNFDSGESY